MQGFILNIEVRTSQSIVRWVRVLVLVPMNATYPRTSCTLRIWHGEGLVVRASFWLGRGGVAASARKYSSVQNQWHYDFLNRCGQFIELDRKMATTPWIYRNVLGFRQLHFGILEQNIFLNILLKFILSAQILLSAQQFASHEFWGQLLSDPAESYACAWGWGVRCNSSRGGLSSDLGDMDAEYFSMTDFNL